MTTQAMHIGTGADVAKVVDVARPSRRARLIARAYANGHTAPETWSCAALHKWIEQRERPVTDRERIEARAWRAGHPRPHRTSTVTLIAWLKRHE